MPNRTTKVALVAEVSQYLSGMQAAAQKTRELGSETEKLGQKREAIAGVGTAMTAFGAVAVASVGLAVAKYAEFDAAMSSVQAATHSSTAEMNLLRDAAIEAGASTVFTATEAANAIEELAKAGVSTNDILGGGLSGALDLASAGELKVADAAQIAATAMTQFGEKGSEVPHIADLLAAGAGKAQGSVEDLAQALNQGGLVAAQSGHDIEETTGVLAAFASAGLLGSDAGTSLKTAIIALQNPSEKARGVMKDYGIDVYDASGQMLSFGGIAAQLEDRLGGLSDEQRNAALATIFGNDAVRAANVLYSEGADGIAEWTGKVNDNGYAAETARLKLDNLKGDIEKLGGAFDTALIQSGSSANDTLRGLVQSATFLVDGINELPQPVIGAGVAVTALAGGVALVGGAVLRAVPTIASMKVQLATLGVSMRSTAALTGVVGAGFGALALAVGTWVSISAEAKAAAEAVTDTLDDQSGAITKYTRAAIAKQLSDKGLFDAAKKAGVSQKELTDAILEGGDAYDRVKDQLGGGSDVLAVAQGYNVLTGEFNNSRIGLDQVRKSLIDGKVAFDDNKAANAESGDTAASAAEQYQQEAAKVSDLTTELSDLISQINAANGVNQDAISANADYLEALDGLKSQVDEQRKSIEGYTTSLDENTSTGASNAAMLSEIAAKAQTSADATYKSDQATMSAEDATSKYVSTLAEQRRQFEDSAVAAGFSSGEVKKLADRVFQLPSAKEVDILVETAKAQQDLDRWITLNNGRTVNIRTVNNISEMRTPGGLTAKTEANGGVLDFYADGGVRENHVAQIAPAGSWRVWAEPETEGEAYIPFAKSKRSRSLAIWEETGRRLEAFADGGIRKPQPTYVPTPPQLVYVGGPSAGSSAGAPSRPPIDLTFNTKTTDPAEVVRLAMDELNWEARRT